MQNKAKKFSVFLAALLLILALFPLQALAASCSVSGGSVKAGNAISVKVTFKQTDLYGPQASFSYDKSLLQYTGGSEGVSNGTIAHGTTTSKSSMTFTIKFKALKAGKAKVSVKGYCLSYASEKQENVSGSGTVTITSAATTASKAPASKKPSNAPASKAPAGKATVSPSPGKTPDISPSPSPSPSQSVVEKIGAIDIGDKVGKDGLFLWPTLEDVTLPEGFELVEGNYDGKKIEVAKNTKTNVSLAYTTNEQGENGSFYLLSDSGDLFPYVRVTSSTSYTILSAPAGMDLPEGYVEAAEKLALADHDITTYVREDGENPDLHLIYAVNAEGKTGFYLYDKTEETFQRFTANSIPVEVDNTKAASTTADEAKKSGGDFFSRLLDDPAIATLCMCLLAGCVVLLGLFVITNSRYRTFKKSAVTSSIQMAHEAGLDAAATASDIEYEDEDDAGADLATNPYEPTEQE